MATKKCLTKDFFHPSLFYLFLDPGSGIRDPGSGMGKNEDPGSGINIPDPQHWYTCTVYGTRMQCVRGGGYGVIGRGGLRKSLGYRSNFLDDDILLSFYITEQVVN